MNASNEIHLVAIFRAVLTGCSKRYHKSHLDQLAHVTQVLYCYWLVGSHVHAHGYVIG